uniref:Cholesteryl ester transfer protein n=1 Tax=Sphenodon punctatus TaxID=8508 RepID=A0A8D0G798_SPHPU
CALIMNQQTTEVIQAAFRHASYPDIKGEKSMRFLGKVAYGLTNIQISDLFIENSEVDFKEEDTIDIAIHNVTASFKGTLSYGYTGAWFVKLIHSIDFEIESSIDLQINTKLTCEEERVVADTSDFVSSEKHTQFGTYTAISAKVCKEINFLAQLLAEFIQNRAANFLQDGDIGVDISLTSFPVIKGLLLYKNYSDAFCDSSFNPSLLSESRMLYFWFSDHVLNSLALAAFMDGRLVLTITGDELKVTRIFQDRSFNDSMAKIWNLTPPQISLQPEGTIVKSSVAAELRISSDGDEPSVALYFEKVDAAHTYNETSLYHSIGIEPALTALMNSKGLQLFEIRNPEVITQMGYFIIQLDFGFPHHLLVDFLRETL